MRLFSVFILIFLLGESVVTHSQQLTEEEKRRLFLQAREEMKTIPYTPPPTQDPNAARPKPRPTAPNTSDPTAPRPTVPAPAPPAPPTPQPPVPPLAPTTPTQPANIRIEESAVREADQEPEPEPEKSKGWWIFGGGESYTFLTPAIRKAINKPSVRKGRWRYIVVHNSGTKQGNAKAFEYYHRNVRRMPNGMAYHFVIGNGTSSKDGQIEIGGRWHKQLQGGHVHSDYLNNISVGICLVGDFNKQQPTRKQQEALEELIKYLRSRVGRIDGRQASVKPHRDINPPKWPTDCPGDDFPYRWLRKF